MYLKEIALNHLFKVDSINLVLIKSALNLNKKYSRASIDRRYITFNKQLKKERFIMSNLELLNPENSALILIDFQPQMTFGVASIDRQTLINNVMLLAKSAKLLTYLLFLLQLKHVAFLVIFGHKFLIYSQTMKL